MLGASRKFLFYAKEVDARTEWWRWLGGIGAYNLNSHGIRKPGSTFPRHVAQQTYLKNDRMVFPCSQLRYIVYERLKDESNNIVCFLNSASMRIKINSNK